MQVFGWTEKYDQLENIFPLTIKLDQFLCKMNYTSIFLLFIVSLKTKQREREKREETLNIDEGALRDQREATKEQIGPL